MTLSHLIRSPSGIVVLETIAVACLMFGTFSVLVRVTDMATVGLWVLVKSLLEFSRAADFWSRGLASFVGEARGRDNQTQALGYATTAVLSGIVGYGLLAALGALAIYHFAGLLVAADQVQHIREIVPLMALSFWLLSVSGTYFGAFLAFSRPILKALHTIGGAIFFLLLSISLAPTYGLWGILIAQTLQAAMVFVSCLIVFRMKIAGKEQTRWQSELFKKLIGFGSKMTFVGFLQLAIEPVIRVLASLFGDLSAVAAVELASRLIGVVRSTITSLGQILIPDFSRRAATGDDELAGLFRDVTRLYLFGSISAFSLILAAAPAVEELVFASHDTGLLAFVWILSIGWFANTITAPAHFLLTSQRRVWSLFWCHFIMAAGALTLGIGGGFLMGVNASIAGPAVALTIAAIYLLRALGHNEITSLLSLIKTEPVRILPLLIAIIAATSLEVFEIAERDVFVRFASYSMAIGATLGACLFWGDVRGLLKSASKLR